MVKPVKEKQVVHNTDNVTKFKMHTMLLRSKRTIFKPVKCNLI